MVETVATLAVENLKKLQWKKIFYMYYIEPVVFVLVFAHSLSGTVMKNEVIYQACTVIFNYTVSDCKQLGNKNSSDYINGIETEVQPYVAHLFMVRTLLESVVPAICGVFIGSWSDHYGRKPLLFISMIGFSFTYLIATVICELSLTYSVNPWYYIIAVMPHSILGGNCVFSVAAFCFVSDVTDTKTRPYRMIFLEVFLFTGLMGGSLMSSFVYTATNATITFLISGLLMCGATVFIWLYVPESLHFKLENNDMKKESINLDGAYEKKSENDCEKAKEERVEAKEDPLKAKEDPSKAKEDPVKVKEDHVKAKEDHVKAKEDPVKVKEDHVKAKEDHVKAKEDPVKVKEDHVKVKEDPVKAKEDSLKAKEDHVKAKEDSLKAKEDPLKAKEDPEKAKTAEAEEEKKAGLFSYVHIKDMLATCFKERPHYDRSIIWLITGTMFLSVFVFDGAITVLYLFVREKFHWSVRDFNLYESASHLVPMVGALFGFLFLRNLFKMSVVSLAILSFLSSMLSSIVRGVASEPWHMYLSIAFGVFHSIGGPMCRTIISNIVPPTDLGKIFSIKNIMQSIAPFVAAPLYTLIYKQSLTTFPGLFNIVSAFLYLIAFIFMVVVMYFKSTHKEHYKKALN